jgi:transcriptional regulator with XRE-family HTH domain
MNSKVFFQELGKKLIVVRKTAGLTQVRIAKEIGLTRQYIIQIEKGKAKNPTVGVIFTYLDVCNVRWTDFFAEFKRRIDKIDNDQVIKEAGLSSATGLSFRQKQKVDRDISYYRMRIDGKKGKAKSLSEQQKHRAAVKFGKYRLIIEPLEAEVQKKLGELNVPIAHNQAYKDFTRECFSALKKYYHKDQLLLTQRFAEIMKSWQAQGLKEEVLLIIKDIVIAHFEPAKQGK